MKKFKYNAPTPCHFTSKGNDYSFYPGETYELPGDLDFVKTLTAQGKMTEVAAPIVETEKPPKK